MGPLTLLVTKALLIKSELFWADANKPMSRPGGDTPLCIAVKRSYYLVVRLLIERGADVNKSGPGGDTPLYIAALEGHHLVDRLLMERGANVNMSRSATYSCAGEDTPLNCAVLKGHTRVVKELLKVPGVDYTTPLTTALLLGEDHPIRTLLRDYVAVNPSKESTCYCISCAVARLGS
jgi:ankyrin repeat protein